MLLPTLLIRLVNFINRPNPNQEEIENFKRDYPRWWHFLGFLYPLDEYDYSSDKEAIHSRFALGDDNDDDYVVLMKEADALFSAAYFPWHAISYCAQSTFENEEEARRWFENLINLMKNRVSGLAKETLC